MNIEIRRILASSAAMVALTLFAPANADIITVEEFPDNFGGPISCLGGGSDTLSLSASDADCEAAGGFVMTSFGDDPNPAGTSVTSVDSPLGGTMHFLEQGGTDPVTDSLQMIVGDPSTLVGDPNWWQYSDHSSVYMTGVHWIELLFDTTDANPVRAVSLYVGAEFNGRGWIEGFDDQGNVTRREYFGVNPDNSPGFGVYGDPGSCSTISRIVVEPYQLWGVGNFAINQDPCVTVPAPGTLALLGIGLFGMGLARRRQKI